MMIGTATGDYVCIVNDVGGTTALPAGSYRVRVTRSWDDYEIGGRMVGELLDDADVAVSRLTGTTGYGPKCAFRPEVVYFAKRDFREEVIA